MSDFENLNAKFKDLSNIKLPEIKLHTPDFSFHNSIIDGIDTNGLSKVSEELQKFSEEKHQREVENNESLKNLVSYNEEISSYNRELVKLNEKILNKINSLDDTLLFLSSAFDKKAYSDKTLAQEHNALLLELILIIESQDNSKLQQFMSGVAAPVGAGLIVEYFKMKLGLTGM